MNGGLSLSEHLDIRVPGAGGLVGGEGALRSYCWPQPWACEGAGGWWIDQEWEGQEAGRRAGFFKL